MFSREFIGCTYYTTMSSYIIKVISNNFGIKLGTIFKATMSKSGNYYIISWNDEKLYLNKDCAEIIDINHSNMMYYPESSNIKFKIRNIYI